MDYLPLIIASDGMNVSRHLAIMGAARRGKSMMLAYALRDAAEAARRAGETMRSLRHTFIVHDEFFRAHLADVAPRIPRDRADYHRGGRYRKPPTTKLEKPPEPGMVQVRDRAGVLVWKKLGKGMG